MVERPVQGRELHHRQRWRDDLVRNTSGIATSDNYRGAYPDKWVVKFGIEDKIIDQRLIASTGEDATAVQYGAVQPENLASIFKDSETALPEFADRAISGFDPYSRYYWLDVTKVTNVKLRQAMAVALNREAIPPTSAAHFYGTYADGFIKPNIGQDYAETGFWDTFFGQAVPNAGDPDLAKKLITDSDRGRSGAHVRLPGQPDQPEDGRDRHRLARQGWHHCHAEPDREARTTRPCSPTATTSVRPVGALTGRTRRPSPAAVH